MLKIKRNKFLCILLLLFLIFGVNNTSVQAGYNYNDTEENYNYKIDSSIINKEISKWNKKDTYNYSDLVMYNNKIYFACDNIKGLVPGESEKWLLKADLNMYQNKSESSYLYESSSLVRTAAIKVIAYNAALSTSKYQFSIRALLPGTWTAQVNSVIEYDNGRHVIIKNDFFKDDMLYLNASQVRNYYYPHISKVTVILSGTFKGEVLASTGMTMYP